MDLANKQIDDSLIKRTKDREEYHRKIGVVKELLWIDIEVIGRIIIIGVVTHVMVITDFTLGLPFDSGTIELVARFPLLAWALLPLIKGWKLFFSGISELKGEAKK